MSVKTVFWQESRAMSKVCCHRRLGLHSAHVLCRTSSHKVGGDGKPRTSPDTCLQGTQVFIQLHCHNVI